MPQAQAEYIPKRREKREEESMVAQSMKLLPALLFLLFLLLPAQGARTAPAAPASTTTTKCGLSSVSVETVNTGEKATSTVGGGHDPVFEVTVRNLCACAVRGVSLRSEGFASSVAVDPRLFRREARDYLVGGGARIETGAAVRFRYAWDRAFRMAPAAVHDDCS